MPDFGKYCLHGHPWAENTVWMGDMRHCKTCLELEKGKKASAGNR